MHNPIYSRRLIQFLHPQDIEEALDYFSTNNNIIQHRFFRDRRNQNNISCYICGELKDLHLGYIVENNNNENNINNKNENIEINNNIEKNENEINNNENNNIQINNNENNNIQINNNEINIEFNENQINSNQINNNAIKLNINNENNNSREYSESKNTSFIGNINQTFSKQISCSICSGSFASTNNNTMKTCGHSFCDSCWYDFLCTKIKDNKLASIKCLDYECQEKLSDEFIINLLNNDKDLISKYKKYKLELDIINDPNKKLCPYPNCDSYLQLKNKKMKISRCQNKHTFCFFCLGKPHSNSPCKKEIDKSLLEFSKNNFIKKCPNCGIITEKSSGCNHIICSKCNYQWCWLCNKQYTVEHYTKGKCKGFQFYKPKNENDIKLAFEGKVKLRESQRQEDVNYPNEMIDNFNNLEIDENSNRFARVRRRRRIRRDHINNIYYQKHGFKTTCFVFLIYLLFGNIIASIFMAGENEIFTKKKIWRNIILLGYFLYEISNFFFIIYSNIIMLIPYLINLGFYRFIHICQSGGEDLRYALIQIINQIVFLTLFFFIGLFFNILNLERKICHHYNFFQRLATLLIGIIYTIIYFPIQIIPNLIVMTINTIKYKGRIILDLNNVL